MSRSLLAELSALSGRGLKLCIPLCLILWSCADEALPPRERQIVVEVLPEWGPGSGNPYREQGPPSEYGINSARLLVIGGEGQLRVPRGGESDLQVLLFDREGEPVAGEQIEYEIIRAEAEDSILSARRTLTDALGAARVAFVAGEVTGRFEVEAYHAESRRVRFEVEVVDLPSGRLEIRAEYQGPAPIGSVDLYLSDEARYCDAPYYLAPPEGIVLSEEGLSLNERFLTGPLLAGERYSVVARAYTREQEGAPSVLAAAGCVGEVRIIEGEPLAIVAPLLTLALDPTGTFNTINHLDFTGAIPGRLGDVIDQLRRFFGDQDHEREIAGVLFDLVADLAREAVGSLGAVIIDLIANWIEDDLNDLLNRYIDLDGPEWIRSFFTIGTDLISVVSRLEVISDVVLMKPRRDGVFEGSQNWVGLALYWRLGCQEEDGPDCGRYPFTMEELADGAEEIRLVFGQFTGRLHSYNQGIIDLHNLDLQYGRLILFVLNELILPRVADGARNITDALLYLANCPGFANRLTGGEDYLRLGGFNIVSRRRIE
ncbi:MAG: hypothetical protein VYD19_00785, partial [Myxococcota bacterium]|nr:hypothetical protein [Myxococcota bacterium]